MESLSNLVVSYQNNFWSPLRNRSLYEVLEEIKQDDHAASTLKLREHYNLEDGLYHLKKKQLSAATFCANFKSDHRTKEGLNHYNEVMIIDIDDVGLDSISEIFKCLSKDKYIFALWLSPSGNGIKGLIKLKYEFKLFAENIDMWHYSAFNKITSYFKKEYEIQIDQSGKDYTRLCFISHDSNIVIKQFCDISLFVITLDDYVHHNRKRPSHAAVIDKNKNPDKQLRNILHNPKGKNKPSNKKMVQKIVKYLKKNKKSITFEYDNWLRVALAISNSFTFDVGEKYFLELSSMDDAKYDEQNCKMMLVDCYRTSKKLITFNTIIHLASQQGFKNEDLIGLEST